MLEHPTRASQPVVLGAPTTRAPLGFPPSHRSPNPCQSFSLAPPPLESRGAGKEGGGVPEPYLGAPAGQERAAAGPERGGGWGGDGPRPRGRAGGRGGGQEQ